MVIRKFIFMALIILFFSPLNNCIAASPEYDLDYSGCVDYSDLKIISSSWLDDCNQDNNWCNNTDFDKSGKVNFNDYSALTAYWKKEPGLLGWWQFNETSGNISADSSGNSNDANLIGEPARFYWEFDHSLGFNGIDQYAIIDNESFFDVTGNLTITCWIKKDDNELASCLVSKGDSYRVYIDPGSTAVAFACRGTDRPVSSTKNICDNKWHHIAAVYNGSTKKIYIDGILDSFRNSPGLIIANDRKVTIASDDSLPNMKLRGTIDEVHIYNIALSSEKIKAIADQYFAVAHYTTPPNNAMFQLTDLTLTWTPGRYAITHDIYFGTDFDAVDNATPDSNEYIGNYTFDTNSFSPPDLQYDQTYYWRIDEVNDLD